MKHKLTGNHHLAVELQSFVSFEDPAPEQRRGETAGRGRNFSAWIRRRLAGLGRADLEEALLRGLAWGNGRGLR